jgi:hypothetical protein
LLRERNAVVLFARHIPYCLSRIAVRRYLRCTVDCFFFFFFFLRWLAALDSTFSDGRGPELDELDFRRRTPTAGITFISSNITKSKKRKQGIRRMICTQPNQSPRCMSNKEEEKRKQKEKEKKNKKSSSRLSMHRNYEKSSYSSYSFHIQQYPLAATSPAPFSEKKHQVHSAPAKTHQPDRSTPHTTNTHFQSIQSPGSGMFSNDDNDASKNRKEEKNQTSQKAVTNAR